MSRRSEGVGQAYEEVLCHHPHFKDREACAKVTEACQGRDRNGPGSVAWAHSQVSTLPPTAPQQGMTHRGRPVRCSEPQRAWNPRSKGSAPRGRH